MLLKVRGKPCLIREKHILFLIRQFICGS